MNNNSPNMHFIHTQQQFIQPDFQSNQIDFRDVSSTNSSIQQNNMQPSPVTFVQFPMVPQMVPLMIPQDSMPFVTPSMGRNLSTNSVGSLDGAMNYFSTPTGMNMPQFVFTPTQQQQLYFPQVSPQVQSVPASPNGSPINRQQLYTPPTRPRSKSVPGPIQVRDLQKQNSRPQVFVYPRTDSIPQFKNQIDPAPLVLEDYRSGSTVSMQYDFQGSENSCLTSQSRSVTRENLIPNTQQDFSRSCSVDPSYSIYEEEEVGDLLGELGVLSEAAEKSFRKLDDVVKRKYGDKECEESEEIRKFQHAVIEESKYHNQQPKEQKDVFQDLCAEMCFTIMKEVSSRNPHVADLASNCTHHFSFLRRDDMNPRDHDFFQGHDHGRASAIFISLLKMKQQFPRLREDRHSKESNMRGSNVVRMRNKRLLMFQKVSYEFWQRVKDWMNNCIDVQDMFVCRDYQKRTKTNGKEIRTMQGLLLYIVFENEQSSVRFCFECLKLFKQEDRFDKLFRKENISFDCFDLLGKANWEPADFEKFQRVYHLGLALDKRNSRTPSHFEPLRVPSLAKTAS